MNKKVCALIGGRVLVGGILLCNKKGKKIFNSHNKTKSVQGTNALVVRDGAGNPLIF